MTKYVGAIDQGTTSTRFMIFDHAGAVVAIDQKEHEQIYPKPGWVEHDPIEIWTALPGSDRGRAGQGRHHRRRPRRRGHHQPARDHASSGTSRRASRSSTPSSGRTRARTCHRQRVRRRTAGQDRFRRKVGLPLATYFSGPKIRWILDNVPGARASAEAGEPVFGNIDTWLHLEPHRRPQRRLHVTDFTNASRTMLMNLETLDWDDESRASWRPEADAPGDRPPPSDLRHVRRRTGRRSGRGRPGRPAGGPGSARPASPPARRRTPTARAASCS